MSPGLFALSIGMAFGAAAGFLLGCILRTSRESSAEGDISNAYLLGYQHAEEGQPPALTRSGAMQ